MTSLLAVDVLLRHGRLAIRAQAPCSTGVKGSPFSGAASCRSNSQDSKRADGRKRVSRSTPPAKVARRRLPRWRSPADLSRWHERRQLQFTSINVQDDGVQAWSKVPLWSGRAEEVVGWSCATNLRFAHTQSGCASGREDGWW
jgi:hypothetical protein